MKGKTTGSLLFFFLVFFFSSLVLVSSDADAVDELNLTGIVRTVDLRAGTVTVNVTSQTCNGLRRFRFESTLDMEGLEGRKIMFSIDSPVCRADGLYKIKSMGVLQEVNSR